MEALCDISIVRHKTTGARDEVYVSPNRLFLDTQEENYLKENTAIVVLGMHRSGTSALTGVLNQLGIPVGKSLFPAQQGVNEKGFWENRWVVEINEELLFSMGSCWDDWLPLQNGWEASSAIQRYKRKMVKGVITDFSRTPLWAVKDPRMCRLIPIWKQVFAETSTQPFYLLTVRHPSQVIKSLIKRDEFSTDKALLLWLTHNLDMERQSRGSRRMVLPFEQLLVDACSVMEQLEGRLDIEFPISLEQARPHIDNFVSQHMVHHSENRLDGEGPLIEMANETIEAMQQIVKGTDADAAINQLDIIHNRLNVYIESQDPVLIEQIRYLAKERGKYQIIWSNLAQLWSWRLLMPLRFIEKRIRDLI